MQIGPFVLRLIVAVCCGMLWGSTAAAAPSVVAANSVGLRTFLRTSPGAAPAPPVFQSLYSFAAGAAPLFGLNSVNGILYGTLSEENGPGSIFSATTTGIVSELYKFKRNRDGSIPEALTADYGELYGVTSIGGDSQDRCGTVFAVTLEGKENVRSPFACSTSGLKPNGKLLRYNGMLVGETEDGGANSLGSVFMAQHDGTTTALFSFSGPDGAFPSGGLVDLNGTFFGTTRAGGARDDGTVFAILPTGAEKVVFSFSGADGRQPGCRLIAVNGILYGTTSYGGAHDLGTVFALTPAGSETVLHSFGSNPDGGYPSSALLAMGGALFGTTLYGGSDARGSVFEISDKGVYKLLHGFSMADGGAPGGDLTEVGRTFYGTTTLGGLAGGGTLFSITP